MKKEYLLSPFGIEYSGIRFIHNNSKKENKKKSGSVKVVQ